MKQPITRYAHTLRCGAFCFLLGAFLGGVWVATFGFCRTARADDPSKRWFTLVTPHFYVHYYANTRHDESMVAKHVANAAEKAHEVLTKLFSHTPTIRTHIVVSDDTDSANGSAQIVPRNVIQALVTAPDPRSALNDYEDWLYGLIVHEYTHILHIDTIYGLAKLINYVQGKNWAPNQIQPRWFIEGLAVYHETMRTSGGRLRNTIHDMMLRMAVLDRTFLRIDQISSNTRYFPRYDVAYLYGSRFVKYIADRFGESRLSAMSHRYGGTIVPYGINRIAKEVLGHTFVELYDAFKRDLEAHYARQRAQVMSRGLTPARRVTTHGEVATMPSFSHDGKELIYTESDGHSDTVIKILNTSDGRVRDSFVRYGGNSTALTPDKSWIVYEQPANWRTFYSYNDLFVIDRRTQQQFQLTKGLRAFDPSVSPDGRSVVFVMNELGTTSLASLPIEGGKHRILLAGSNGAQFSNPRYSPDGKQLVFSKWQSGGSRDLYWLQLASGTLRQLTRDRAQDLDPIFSADGRRVYFSSDRTGIYNIYMLDLETNDIKQVTNVLGGAFSPAVSHDGTLYFVGFSGSGYDLYSMSLRDETFLEALPYREERPGLESIPNKDYPRQTYAAWRTLYPTSWSLNYASQSQGYSIGLELRGADVIGRHQWALVTGVSSPHALMGYNLSYAYNRFWPSLRLSTYRSESVRGGLQIDNVAYPYNEVGYGVGTSVGLPVLRIPHHGVDLSIGQRLNWSQPSTPRVIVEPQMSSPVIPQSRITSGVTLGIGYGSIDRYAWSISNQKGRALSLSIGVDHPSLGSDSENVHFVYGWSEFIPMPRLQDHVLALRWSGGIGSGASSNRGIFGMGGFPEQDILRSFFDSTRLGGAYLRGYPPSTFTGDQYYLFNSEYRFPVINIERGVSSLPFYVNYIHAALFMDAGDAYSDGGFFRDAKIGIGAELLLNTVIGYYVGTTFRIGYARGLMEQGGNEMHFLLGNPF